QTDSQAADRLAVVAADRLPDRDRAAGPVLAEEDQQADADVDHFSGVCGAVFGPDLFHWIHAALGGIGMERAASGGCGAARCAGGFARADVWLGLFADQCEL